HVSGRPAVEEDVGARRQAVAAGLLREQTHRRERVAEDANASLRGGAARCERGGRILAFRDGGEEVEIDGGLESSRALVRGEGCEEGRDRHFHFGVRLLSLRRRIL